VTTSLLEAISPTAKLLLMKNKKPNTVTPRQKVLSAVAFHQNRLLVRVEKTDVDRLCHFTSGLGRCSDSLSQPAHLAENLKRLAAWCIGWAEVNGIKQDIITLIHQERDQQVKQFVEGQIPFECSSRVADPKRKLRELIQQSGQVALALYQIETLNTSPKQDAWRKGMQIRKNELNTELIQVAALCVGWLESLEEKS
jgi:hypothetical protein